MSEPETSKTESSPKNESFLGEILSTVENTDTSPVHSAEADTTAEIIVEKPKKKPLSTGDFLRIIGAMFFVTLIFFGTFLAFIVFNPGQAQFFIGFGINPGDISSLLKKLVSGIFGGTTFFLSVAWIIFLFRAILTKKEYRKKKTISIILALFFGVLLFSEITLWAFLVQKINATDYENPDGGVIVYDNDKLLSERFKNQAVVSNFDNLIGPMELKFDLKSDANYVSKSMNIEDYQIDFNGAHCQGKDSGIVEWVNPANDQSITCIFDESKVYKPTGVYTGTDRVTHKPKTVSINFPAIHIIWVVTIKKPETYKDHTMTYDASNVIAAGFRDISWYLENNNDKPASKNAVFSKAMTSEPQVLCLSILPGANCDKLFFIPSENEASVKMKILYEQDKENPLEYRFRLENLQVENGEIVGYRWKIDNTELLSGESSFTHIFSRYGTFKVTSIVTDSAGNTTEVTETVTTSPQLRLTKSPNAESFLEILDSDMKSLIANTYNTALSAYVITNVSMENIPTTLDFNATDVKVDNFGYDLTKAEWDFDDDGVFEKTGLKTAYELIEEKRYTFRVRYTFFNKEKGITNTLEEKIIVEPTKKDISLVLKLNQDSEYAPATVHVDGSASVPKKGTITKFIYDFWEWRGEIEGDAIQDYYYSSPGEYTITFTVVRNDGEREQTSRKIVLKDTPKSIVINTSVSIGTVGRMIDFDTQGTIGQIISYRWNFWDGESSEEPTPSHAYVSAGKYQVKITAIYWDKTVRSADREIEIRE